MFLDSRPTVLTLTMSHLAKHPKHRLMMSMLTTCILTAVIGTALVGCDKTDTAPVNQVTILQDEVIVDRSLIYSSNPERYQPSYNLRGTLAPIAQAEVHSPYEGNHLKLKVQQGDWVKPKDTLATLTTKLKREVALFAHHKHISMSIEGDPSLVTSSTNTKSDDPSKLDSDSHSKAGYTLKDITDEIADEIAQEEAAVAASIDSKVQLYDSKEPNATYKKSTSESANPSVKPSSHAKETLNSPTKSLQENDNEATPTHPQSNAKIKAHLYEPRLTPNSASNQDKITTLLTFTAPIEGEVIAIDQTAASSGSVVTGASIMTIADTRELQLIGNLPLTTGDKSTASQLSVGQPVNFKVYDVNTEFSGQISHVTPYPDQGYVVVRAPVIPNAENKAILEYGMQALMTIEYGQVELGVRLPRQAIHEANLDELNQKYTRPVSPIQGYVWVIEQNSRLTYTPVEVVEYFPESDKFLVHGISNDSLICLADLPKDANGKKLSID